MGLIGAGRAILYAGAWASHRGRGAHRRGRRSTLVVAQKRLPVQLLEGTGPVGLTG
jgi:hypothetical protein